MRILGEENHLLQRSGVVEWRAPCRHLGDSRRWLQFYIDTVLAIDVFGQRTLGGRERVGSLLVC
jgi:hypothetical protein